MQKTVQIQIIRNAQVPITVMTAGSAECPAPRSAPAGISYKLQIGSKNRMHMIRVHAFWITSDSVENSPEKPVRNKMIGSMITRLNM